MPHPRRPVHRTLVILLAAVAFGLLAAWGKGQDTDGVSGISQVRAIVGNLSTPWLIVPFVAGAGCARMRSAAVLGLVATIAALVGFYLLTAAVVDLGVSGFPASLRVELSANRGYLEGGLLSGPLLGLAGAWWHRSRALPAAVVVGALLMAEPIVLLLLGAALPGGALAPGGGLPLVVRMLPGWGLSADAGALRIAVYGAEFALGLALAVLGWRRAPAEHR